MAYAVGAVRAGATSAPVSCSVRCDDALLFEGRAWQVIEAGSRLRLIQRAYGLRAGHLTDQRGVHHARGGRVVLEGQAAFNLDGELVDPQPHTEFAIEPGAFRLVVPG